MSVGHGMSYSPMAAIMLCGLCGHGSCDLQPAYEKASSTVLYVRLLIALQCSQV